MECTCLLLLLVLHTTCDVYLYSSSSLYIYMASCICVFSRIEDGCVGGTSIRWGGGDDDKTNSRQIDILIILSFG